MMICFVWWSWWVLNQTRTTTHNGRAWTILWFPYHVYVHDIPLIKSYAQYVSIYCGFPTCPILAGAKPLAVFFRRGNTSSSPRWNISWTNRWRWAANDGNLSGYMVWKWGIPWYIYIYIVHNSTLNINIYIFIYIYIYFIYIYIMYIYIQLYILYR